MSNIRGNIKVTPYEVDYDEEFQLFYVREKGSDISSRGFETEEEANAHLDKVLWGAPLY